MLFSSFGAKATKRPLTSAVRIFFRFIDVIWGGFDPLRPVKVSTNLWLSFMGLHHNLTIQETLPDRVARVIRRDNLKRYEMRTRPYLAFQDVMKIAMKRIY